MLLKAGTIAPMKVLSIVEAVEVCSFVISSGWGKMPSFSRDKMRERENEEEKRNEPLRSKNNPRGYCDNGVCMKA